MTVVVRAGAVFDGTGADPVPGGEVVIEDGRVAAGPAPDGGQGP
jgi:N-acyl-D-aspartate/D-glutamate deacylase